MNHNKISDNKSINSMIYKCFKFINKQDSAVFVHKFDKISSDESQCLHTFRELILGAYLCSVNFIARYDKKVFEKTPDWCFYDDAENLIGIVEQATLHIDYETVKNIEKQRQEIGAAFYSRDENTNNIDRLYISIRNKAEKYKKIVEQKSIPFVVSIFGDFLLCLDFEKDVYPCVFDGNKGLFKLYPYLSGVIIFVDTLGQYLFSYAGNPNAENAIHIPSGTFNC